MKRKFLKFIVVLYAVSIPVVTVFGGFFQAMRSFNMAFGNTPRPPHEAFIMDALTAPVQLFVFTPFVVVEFVNSRTGERGRLRREQQRESDAYKAIDKDFDSIVRTAISVWHISVHFAQIRKSSDGRMSRLEKSL